jgi:hypothetical protein
MDTHTAAGWLAMILAAYFAITLLWSVVSELISPAPVWDGETGADVPPSEVRRSWSLYWEDISVDVAMLVVMVWVLADLVPDLLLPVLVK